MSKFTKTMIDELRQEIEERIDAENEVARLKAELSKLRAEVHDLQVERNEERFHLQWGIRLHTPDDFRPDGGLSKTTCREDRNGAHFANFLRRTADDIEAYIKQQDGGEG